MIIIDPGHTYALGVLDGEEAMVLRFVKREGADYPGNTGAQCGTTLQEVFRACLDRIEYLDRQITCEENDIVRFNLRSSINALEAVSRPDRWNAGDTSTRTQGRGNHA